MSPDETLIQGDGGTAGRSHRPGGDEPLLERPGMEIGPYRLIRLLGEGGFSSVWLAERRHPFVQQMAIKFIKAGMDSKAVIARFDQERQALAMMNHPNVARVFDGGFTAQGRPYFAMEFVRGEPINEFCDRQKLSIEDRLRLFTQVCDAVQHAHMKGIIHRDLKPSNVLVSLGDEDAPVAKVIDFGIAKAVSGRMTEQTVFTETGQMIGTPEYMSPEQAEPGAIDIDTRTDVYSLGVILYELLAGALPFEPRDLRSRAYRDMQRMIREEDPPTPSGRLSTIATKDTELATRIAAARKIPTPSLLRTLRSELEWIPLHAMRKDRRERYESPAALALDVENYLAGRPLVAAPESTAYRVRKYVRRNKALVLGVACVAGALVLGLGAALWQARVASAARDQATASEAKAIQEREVAIQAKQEADLQRKSAQDLWTVMAINSGLAAAFQNDPLRAREEMRGLDAIGRAGRFDFGLVGALADEAANVPFLSGIDGMLAVAVSPDGAMIATGGDDGPVRRYSGTSGAPIGAPMTGHSSEVGGLAFSPDGTRIASAGWDKTVRIWSAATGSPVGEPLRGHKGRVMSVAFSPDGKVLASGGSDKVIVLWDPATGRPIGEPLRGHENSVVSLAFSPDGSTLVSGSTDRSIRRWDIASGAALGEPLRGHAEGVTAIAFSPDGRMIASASEADGTIRRWKAADGSPVGDPHRAAGARAVGVAFVNGGRWLASCAAQRALVLLDAVTGEQITRPLSGHFMYTVCMGATADGSMVVTCDRAGVVRTWDMTSERALCMPIRSGASELYAIAYAPSGRVIAVGGNDNAVTRWDALTGRPLGAPMRGHEDYVNALAFAGEDRVVSVSDDRTVRIWDAGSGAQVGEPLKGHTREILCVAVSPDGKLVASGGVDRTVRLWRSGDGASVGAPLKAHSNSVRCAAFSPDGSLLLTGTTDYPAMDSRYEADAVLWRVEDGSEVLRLKEIHRNSVDAVAFTANGQAFLTLGEDGFVGFWRTSDGERLGQPADLGRKSDEGRVVCGALSPGGELLAATGAGGLIRMIDLASRRMLGTALPNETRLLRCLAFSPDGSALAACGEDGLIRIWDTVPVRARIDGIRRRGEEVRRVRELLADRLATPPADEEEVRALQQAVLGDPRLQGDLRTAALIVVGEEWRRIGDAQR